MQCDSVHTQTPPFLGVYCVPGVIAAQQPAHARAPPPAQPAPVQAPVQAGNSKLDDGWLLTDFNEDKLLFKPFSAAEVEEAVEQVGLAGGRCGN
eukprot:1136940-Pelagomonas_calceolata.AAC.2